MKEGQKKRGTVEFCSNLRRSGERGEERRRGEERGEERIGEERSGEERRDLEAELTLRRRLRIVIRDLWRAD